MVTNKTKLLTQQIQNTPVAPGIYKMLDKKGQIIYIGKAKNLKRRIASYFQKNHSRKITRILMQQVRTFDTIVTDSEKEALILEDHLIKQNQPFFNVELKDNKTYPYLWLMVSNGYPRLIKTRIIPPRKRGYLFGPYTDVQELNMYIEIIQSLYPLKKCTQEKFAADFKPCLYYDIGQCLDYCTGQVSKKQVQSLIEKIRKIIIGSQKNKHPIIAKLNERMQREIALQHFERAQEIKEKIALVKNFNHQQKILFRHENNFDIIESQLSDDFLIIVVLEFRMGKLSNKKTYECFNLPEIYEPIKIKQWQQTTLEKFIISYYSDASKPVLEEVIVSPSLQNISEIENEIFVYLQEQITHPFKFSIKQPQKGKKSNLLKLAKANVRLSASEIKKKKQKETFGKELKKLLQLKELPKVIESFDIANTDSQSMMAGLVRFVDGEKDKANYRLFNIKTIARQNDFAAIAEAVYRRYKRLLTEKKSLPDLILIDGGKGQLSAAQKSLERLGIRQQAIISLAKREEEIFVPKKKDPLKVSITHPALFFLISIRDETHRFVNSSHRRQRDRLTLESILMQIPNIGLKKRQILYREFESIAEIKTARLKQICSLPYFSEKDFKAIQKALVKH